MNTRAEVTTLAKAYVKKKGNLSGGHLHIVLCDMNLDDSSVMFCWKAATKAGDTDGEALAEAMLGLSMTQRKKVRQDCWRS